LKHVKRHVSSMIAIVIVLWQLDDSGGEN